MMQRGSRDVLRSIPPSPLPISIISALEDINVKRTTGLLHTKRNLEGTESQARNTDNSFCATSKKNHVWLCIPSAEVMKWQTD